jgi:hypothetical protein
MSLNSPPSRSGLLLSTSRRPIPSPQPLTSPSHQHQDLQSVPQPTPRLLWPTGTATPMAMALSISPMSPSAQAPSQRPRRPLYLVETRAQARLRPGPMKHHRRSASSHPSFLPGLLRLNPSLRDRHCLAGRRLLRHFSMTDALRCPLRRRTARPHPAPPS